MNDKFDVIKTVFIIEHMHKRLMLYAKMHKILKDEDFFVIRKMFTHFGWEW